MNIPLNERMLKTIKAIEKRRQPEAVVSYQKLIRQSKIPKTSEYYTNLANGSRSHPYLRSVYLRCAKLAREGKTRDINRLLFAANETLIKKKDPAAWPQAKVAKAVKHKYQLRSKAPNKKNIGQIAKTLNQYIIDYTEQIKHKKTGSLYKFLLGQYKLKRRYNEFTKKFRQG